jgi:hypothetical protein
MSGKSHKTQNKQKILNKSKAMLATPPKSNIFFMQEFLCYPVLFSPKAIGIKKFIG